MTKLKEILKKVWAYILERGQEKSTVLTFITLACGFLGLTVSPEKIDVIAKLVVAILVAIGTFTKEVKK